MASNWLAILINLAIMTGTISIQDFQCLQDQLVELRTKNYDLQSSNQKAKAKITALHKQLEEQESSFKLISSTLRNEIEAISNNATNKIQLDAESNVDQIDGDQNFKVKYKAVKHKAKEIVRQMQQLDSQNKQFLEKINELSDLNNELTNQRDTANSLLQDAQSQLESSLKSQENVKLKLEKIELDKNNLIKQYEADREDLENEISRHKAEISNFDSRLAEERKIYERKGLQTIKELQRQLVVERKLVESLKLQIQEINIDDAKANSANSNNQDTISDASIGEMTTGASSSRIHDPNSSGVNENGSEESWSFLHANNNNNNAITNSNSNVLNSESLSLCSIDSTNINNDQEVSDSVSKRSSQNSSSVQQVTSRSVSHELKSEDRLLDGQSANQTTTIASNATTPDSPFYPKPREQSSSFNSASFKFISEAQLMDEQAALMDRLTQLQKDKWHLEEKTSYLEQVNISLVNELADKTDVIRNYFLVEAEKNVRHNQQNDTSVDSLNQISNRKRNSISSSTVIGDAKQFLEKPSLKKVVHFVKEKSHLSGSGSGIDSDSVKAEALVQMQKMLEETLVKLKNATQNTNLNN